MVVMMKIFERQMRQVFRKEKLIEYAINLGKKADIDDSRFYKNDNGTMVCDVLICFPDEYEKLIQDNENFQSKIHSLEKTLKENKKSIEMLENQLSSIDEENQKEIKRINDEYSKRIDELKEDLHDKDIEIEKVRTKYEKEIGNLKESNQSHINELKLFDKDKHILLKDHNEEVSKLKESQFNPESDMKISDHNLEVNGIKNRIVKETIHHNDTINKLDSIGFLKFIKGDLKKVRNELKEDIQQYEYIAEYIESKNGEVILEIKKDEENDS